jgi:hypothetical protein
LKKLTPEEITRTVAKIRARYDDYIRRFLRPKSVRTGFENRYLVALKDGVDISSFLLAEASAVDELIRREESKASGPAHPEGPPRAAPAPSATDRILERQREMIAGYPDVHIHPDANEEVRRMMGALSVLARERWDPLTRVLRVTSYSSRSTAMANLEHDIRNLGFPLSDGVSAALSHYVALLKRFPRDYADLEREQKNYLLAASFVLHDLEEILNHVLEAYPQLPEEGVQVVRDTVSYVSGLIDNFRLRELKRRK